MSFIDPLYFENEKNVIDKLNFNIYFIYYFAKDYYTCYSIYFLILPYYDSRIKNSKDYHSYNVVKKNTISNHNITKVGTIDF